MKSNSIINILVRPLTGFSNDASVDLIDSNSSRHYMSGGTKERPGVAMAPRKNFGPIPPKEK